MVRSWQILCIIYLALVLGGVIWGQDGAVPEAADLPKPAAANEAGAAAENEETEPAAAEATPPTASTTPPEEVLPLEVFTNNAGEEFDLSTFTNYGIYFLEDITLARLAAEASTANVLAEFDFKAFVLGLIEDDQEVIIRKLAIEIDPAYAEEGDISFLKQEVLKVLNPLPAPAPAELAERRLFAELPIKGLVLEQADIVDVYDNKVGDVEERMVDLYGQVGLYVDDSEISADFIRINLTRREAFAEGNVIIKIGVQILRSERALWNVNDNYGFVFNSKGEIGADYYFEASLVRVNSRNYTTLQDGWLTFSSNEDPYYRISSTKFDLYDREKWITQNVLITVGDHPFLWLPYYINFPLSARLELRFGEARREGYYALTKFGFPVPYIGEVLFRFNVYEKLGLYSSLENSAVLGRLSYNFFLAGALYTYNENTRTTPRLAYTYHTGQYLESRSRLRHRVVFNQILSLTDPESTLVRSSIDFSVTNVSDPFITDNFPNNLSHIDWRKLIERHDRDEDLYNPRVSDRDGYAIKYTLSAPSLALGANFRWDYDVYDDPARSERPVDERYHMYLKTFSLPNINLSHSGTLDPTVEDSTRVFFLNLGYKLGFGYNGLLNYKDGEEVGAGLSIRNSVKPYELINEQYALNMDLSLDRPFSINTGPTSLAQLNVEWFRWTLTPSFALQYKRDWVGKDYSTSDNDEEDRSDVTLRYGFSQLITFNQNEASFIDASAMLAFTVNTTNTTFRLPQGEFFSGTTNSLRREKAYNYLLGTSYTLSFPSTKRVGIWAANYNYTSMLPYISATIAYQESATTSAASFAARKDFAFDHYSYRRLTSSLSFTQKGYGLFYLPRFDYVFTHNIALSYNFLPDASGRSTVESKFESFGGSFSLDFIYNYFRDNNINWNNTFTYRLFDANRQEIVPELYAYQLNFSLGYNLQKPSRYYVDVKKVEMTFNWNYYFKEIDYLKDSMGFTFTLGIDIVNRYALNLSLSSINSSSYLYFREKAVVAGQGRVNFFRDIGASLGFYGVEGLARGLFKLNAFTVNFTHDLGDWFTSFSYTFLPVRYADDSLRGYYLEHKIAFQVNLRPERDPRGVAEARRSPFFDNIERNEGSNIFGNIIRN